MRREERTCRPASVLGDAALARPCRLRPNIRIAPGSGLPSSVTIPSTGTSGGPAGPPLQPTTIKRPSTSRESRSFISAAFIQEVGRAIEQPRAVVRCATHSHPEKHDNDAHGSVTFSPSAIAAILVRMTVVGVLRDEADGAVAHRHHAAAGMQAAGPAPASDVADLSRVAVVVVDPVVDSLGVTDVVADLHPAAIGPGRVSPLSGRASIRRRRPCCSRRRSRRRTAWCCSRQTSAACRRFARVPVLAADTGRRD